MDSNRNGTDTDVKVPTLWYFDEMRFLGTQYGIQHQWTEGGIEAKDFVKKLLL